MRKISLIATVLNEREHLREWLDWIGVQSRLPDEIVICDGGSTDGTYEELLARVADMRAAVPLRVVHKPGSSIAAGRNAAIAAARGEIIAVTDAGCRPQADWLECLVQAFETDSSTQVVSGYYRFTASTRFQKAAAAYLGRPWNSSSFLPSSRSIAFTREVWNKVGGYPEWLTNAGEDTLFNRMLLEQDVRFEPAPKAIVFWEMRPNVASFLRMIARNAWGDAESGVAGADVSRTHLKLLFPLVLAGCAGALIGDMFGYGLALGGLAVLLLVGLCTKALSKEAPLGSWPEFFLLSLLGGPAYVWGYWRGRFFGKKK